MAKEPNIPTVIRQPDGRLMDLNPRCWQCKKLLAVRLAHPWEVNCPRCGARNCNMPEALMVLSDTEELTSEESGAIVSETP